MRRSHLIDLCNFKPVTIVDNSTEGDGMSLEIMLQRASSIVRFQSPGENSPSGCPKDDEQLYFEIGFVHEKGTAIVTASCVEGNEPHHAHGRFALSGENCINGIYTAKITSDLKVKATCIVSNIFVQHINEDRYEPSDNDVVKVKFEVKTEDETVPGSWKTSDSVISQPIYDKAYFGQDENGVHIIPRIEIIRQPISDVIYRYDSERSQPEWVRGVNSTKEDKMAFPEIRLLGCEGPARVEFSCITNDEPYRLHPHCLTSKNPKNCRQGGVYVVEIEEARDAIVPLENLGIMCVKRKNYVETLSARQRALTFNPYEHNERNGASIRVDKLRILCQAFVRLQGQRDCSIIVQHVVSEPINDKRVKKELGNNPTACVTSGPSTSRAEMMLTCNKVKGEPPRKKIKTVTPEKTTGNHQQEFGISEIVREVSARECDELLELLATNVLCPDIDEY